MIGNVYGVDVKLSPRGDSVVPKTIEINGADFGTDFFKYEEGFSYYDSFMTALANQTKGKPIFIPRSRVTANDSLEVLTTTEYLDRKKTFDSNMFGFYKELFGNSTYLDSFWIDDNFNHQLETIAKTPDAETRFYYLAAKKLGIPIFLYDSIDYHNNTLEFYSKGTSSFFTHKDIGVIWGGSYEIDDAPDRFEHLFLNNKLIENALYSKSFTRFLIESDAIDSLFPAAISTGTNGTPIELILKFLKKLESELVVIKPDTGSQGVGVKILKRKDLIRDISSIDSTFNFETFLGIMMYINSYSLGGFPHEKGLQLIEEFVPSIPIYNPISKKMHDGCARIVVFSPEKGTPYAIDSQWRLAPEPMDSKIRLEQRFRANLSRGATAHMIDPTHKTIMESHAIETILFFEQAVSVVSKYISRIIEKRSPKDTPISKLNALRNLYFKFSTSEITNSLGISDFSMNEISYKDNVSRIEEEGRLKTQKFLELMALENDARKK